MDAPETVTYQCVQLFGVFFFFGGHFAPLSLEMHTINLAN